MSISMDPVSKVYTKAGMRVVVCQGVLDFLAPGILDPAAKMEVCRDCLETWQGRDTLITPELFAHSCYTRAPETL
ncbi:hypothetical protein DFAR_2210014 [Desulfarculales bacterium]